MRNVGWAARIPGINSGNAILNSYRGQDCSCKIVEYYIGGVSREKADKNNF